MAKRPEIEDLLTYACYVALSNTRRTSYAVGPGGAVPVPDPIQPGEIEAFLNLRGITDPDIRARMADAILAMDIATR